MYVCQSALVVILTAADSNKPCALMLQHALSTRINPQGSSGVMLALSRTVGHVSMALEPVLLAHHHSN